MDSQNFKPMPTSTVLMGVKSNRILLKIEGHNESWSAFDVVIVPHDEGARPPKQFTGAANLQRIGQVCVLCGNLAEKKCTECGDT